VLSQTLMVDTVFPYTVTTKFNATRSQPSALFGLRSSGVNADDPMLAYNYYAMLSRDILASPGVTRSLAYSNFIVQGSIPQGAILSTEVDAFVPSLVCQTLDTSTKRRSFARQQEISHDSNGNAKLVLSYDGSVCKTAGSISMSMLDPWNQTCPPRQIATFENLQGFCDSDEPAFGFFLAEFVYAQQFGENGTIMDASINVPTVNGIVCSPSYAFERLRITYNTTDQNISNPQIRLLGTPSTMNRTSPQFPMGSPGLSYAFYSALSAASNIFGNTGPSVLVPFEESPDTLFHLMATSQGHTDLEILLDVERMKDAATLTFKGIISQYAHSYLKEETNEGIRGEAFYLKDRIHLRLSSLWAMVAGFGVMAGLTVGVLLLRPSRDTPRDPHTIGALSAILTSSDTVRDALSLTGSMNDQELRSNLANCRCTTLQFFHRRSLPVSPSSSSLLEVIDPPKM
jgi:hypothetical protein